MKHAKKITTILIMICVLVVAVDLAASSYFSPDKVVDRELAKIAQDYYENYFYEQYPGKLVSSDNTAELDALAESGFSNVRLRELLLYDGAKYADSAKYFKYEGYTCDTNETYVKFYPTSPYGKTDYRVEYHLTCN